MRRTLLALVLVLAAAAVPLSGLAQETSLQAAPDSGPVSLTWELFRLDDAAREQMAGKAGFEPNFMAVLVMTPDTGWHTYANADPGPNKRPTVLTVRTAPGAEPLPVYYPPGTLEPDPLVPSELNKVYHGPTRFYLPLPPDQVAPFLLPAELSLVLCQDTRCAEPRPRPDLSVSLDQAMTALSAGRQPWWPEFMAALDTGPGQTLATTPGPAFQPLAETESPWSFTPRSLQSTGEIGGLLSALLLGMLAGLLLNVMPCVLPVISLKLTAVLGACDLAAGESPAGNQTARKAVRLHALWFSWGVLLYFLFLALLLGLGGLAWGELFQEPAAVLSLTVLVFVLGLSMLGVFHLPVVDLKFDRKTENPRLQALLTGLLATLLATPCSGPFLGGVLSWALSRPPEVVGLVFFGVGLGMALPYLFLAVFPGLARCVPKPGAWTWYLEKGIGLFLVATCIYLLSILPPSLLFRALIALWLAGVAAWLWGISGSGMSLYRPLLLKLLALVLVVGGIVWALNPGPSADPWEEFDQETFQAALGGQVLLVDFTADWCPTCKALEATTLEAGNVAGWEEDLGVRAIRVDLTEDFPAGEALLSALGLRSIPALAIFPAGNQAHSPLVLRDLFSSGQVEEAIRQASAN